MAFALAIPPLTVKNRPCGLIWAYALNRKNMVVAISGRAELLELLSTVLKTPS